jgi:hypothetical protein
MKAQCAPRSRNYSITVPQFGWKVVGSYPMKHKGAATLFADGALLDDYGLSHGIWEAKDTADNLDKEIKAKFAAG